MFRASTQGSEYGREIEDSHDFDENSLSIVLEKRDNNLGSRNTMNATCWES